MNEKHEFIRLLHFISQGKDYGVDLSKVREVLRISEVTKVDELPPFVRGLVNVRGEWMPVIDFASRSGERETPITLDCRMLVLKIASYHVLLLVERVVEIFETDVKNISSNIQDDLVLDRKYIRGTLSRKTGVLIVVEIERLLTATETSELERAKLHA